MDEQLEVRWRSGRSPFDGRCLRCSEPIDVARLRQIMQIVVDVLCARITGPNLLKFDDWHEHDGYITQAISTTWAELEDILRTDQRLHSSRHGDSYVCWAYYPADFSFLLRYDIVDRDEDPELIEPVGDFDLSADATTVAEALSKLGEYHDCIEVVETKAYFDRVYAG